MNDKRLEEKLNRRLRRAFATAVSASVEDRLIRLSGELESWEDIVRACSMCVVKRAGFHVVNDISLRGAKPQKMSVPNHHDTELEERRADVLIIGGGISGCTIARALMRW